MPAAFADQVVSVDQPQVIVVEDLNAFVVVVRTLENTVVTDSSVEPMEVILENDDDTIQAELDPAEVHGLLYGKMP